MEPFRPVNPLQETTQLLRLDNQIHLSLELFGPVCPSF